MPSQIDTNGNVFNPENGETSNSGCALLTSRLPRSVDVFGFVLSPGQFALVQVLATLMLGMNGSIVLLFAIGAYSLFQKFTGGGGSASSTARSKKPAWKAGGNIKGVKDLPKDPKGG
mmetsp:Transcript_52178/g.60936  ORF Transcript_52178/g.60936 Transcript_52178/m.60936 type:complete len:117 (+) Transcript_52178:65-415(+)|eukprot:CAMPEP_0194365022 /NCGR_PEP_ID=MMETSP0174-20130528/12987_1 /TAXON_ID=216777 /ORGANISM="Proboscia alata, Strain PI-D3" /LENGTH=116 /DNA_ID=CAMNT_0039139417 /DNA_START=21 /DNA_END=371 /DNA_ORIENTATION=-